MAWRRAARWHQLSRSISEIQKSRVRTHSARHTMLSYFYRNFFTCNIWQTFFSSAKQKVAIFNSRFICNICIKSLQIHVIAMLLVYVRLIDDNSIMVHLAVWRWTGDEPVPEVMMIVCNAMMRDCAHYSDVIVNVMASQITGVIIVRSTVCSDADQSSASLTFVRGIHQWPVESPHKGPVTRKMLPFDDVIIKLKWKKSERQF